MTPHARNQGLQIAVIVFVILTVVATGFAVLTATNVRELRVQIAAERRATQEARTNFEAVQAELDEVKGFIGMGASPDTQLMPDLAATRRRYQADLQKYGRRLQSVQEESVPAASYSQSLDSALAVLEQRHRQLTAKNEEIVTLQAQKAGLEATYETQAAQFRKMADAADLTRAHAVSRLSEVESRSRVAEKRFIDEVAKLNGEINRLQVEMRAQFDAQQRVINEQKQTIALKNEVIRDLQPNPYVTAFDGRVTRVDVAAQSAWINVGSEDRLRPGVRFGVQAQGIPPGGLARPKAQLEVVRILGEHLAECRVLADDLRDPILIDDTIYTALWSPGQRTHFALAGRIDLDGDGGDDLERVRRLVADAAGEIDCFAHGDGTLEGSLSTATRYLVIGAIPADAPGKEAYQRMLDQAERYGVQRVSTAVFLDQIGYRPREVRALVTGFEPAGRSPRLFDLPDGGRPVSTGNVSELFQKRRPPQAGDGSAY